LQRELTEKTGSFSTKTVKDLRERDEEMRLNLKTVVGRSRSAEVTSAMPVGSDGAWKEVRFTKI